MGAAGRLWVHSQLRVVRQQDRQGDLGFLREVGLGQDARTCKCVAIVPPIRRGEQSRVAGGFVSEVVDGRRSPSAGAGNRLHDLVGGGECKAEVEHRLQPIALWITMTFLGSHGFTSRVGL